MNTSMGTSACNFARENQIPDSSSIILRSEALPAARALCRTAGPLISEFRLWEPGEVLGIGVSGGKDSLSLCALLLAAETLGLPPCRVIVLHIGPPGNCPCAPQAGRLSQVLPNWPIERVIPIPSPFAEGEEPDCSLCSRHRRRLLFSACLDAGIRTIAFAHHQDDLVQTYLMNLLFHGEASGTMRPLRLYAEGGLRLIRPLLTTPEKRIIAFARKSGLLWQDGTPPQHGPEWHSQRETVRAFLHGLGKRRDQAKRNLAKLASAEFSTIPGIPPASSGK